MTNFNPRSPHGERLVGDVCGVHHPSNFNPRSPHGERPVSRLAWSPERTISIHALLTESDAGVSVQRRSQVVISIHALLTESDKRPIANIKTISNFNPRSPHGERPGVFFAGRTTASFQSTLSSRRATGSGSCHTKSPDLISIHALLTESDGKDFPIALDRHISIHALLTESDALLLLVNNLHINFNPRSPHGERQQIPPNWPYRFCLKCQF